MNPTRLAALHDPQQGFDVAVVIPTLLRPRLRRAVESVFRQDLPGKVQILVGIGCGTMPRPAVTLPGDEAHAFRLACLRKNGVALPASLQPSFAPSAAQPTT